MKISMIHCQDGYLSSFTPSVKIKQNWKNNPYGLCKNSAFVCYLEDFVPVVKISTSYWHRKLPFTCSEKIKEMRNYDWVQKYLRAARCFRRTVLHKSAELSAYWTDVDHEKKLIVSRVTRVNLSNQTRWTYISHNRAIHKDFYKTNSNYVICLYKTIPAFFLVWCTACKAVWYWRFLWSIARMVNFPLLPHQWK